MQKKIYNSSNIIYYAVPSIFCKKMTFCTKHGIASLLAISAMEALVKIDGRRTVVSLEEYPVFEFLKHAKFDSARNLTLEEFVSRWETRRLEWHQNTQ